jgi:hypothetical protein
MDDDVRAALQLIDKRLDWIEENLLRVQGLQYVAMGRADHRPDETAVPPEVRELARAGKTQDAIKLYRQLTGVDFAHAQAVVNAL